MPTVTSSDSTGGDFCEGRGGKVNEAGEERGEEEKEKKRRKRRWWKKKWKKRMER